MAQYVEGSNGSDAVDCWRFVGICEKICSEIQGLRRALKLDFILQAVADVIRQMSAILGNWTWTRNLADDLVTIAEYLQKANALLPVSAALTLLGLFVTLELLMIAYYWISRAINLLRGAG